MKFHDVIILQHQKYFIRGIVDMDISPLYLFNEKSGYYRKYYISPLCLFSEKSVYYRKYQLSFCGASF